MTDEEEDAFLNNATHAVNGEWLTAGGTVLTNEEMDKLNDLLTEFFTVKIQLLKDKPNG